MTVAACYLSSEGVVLGADSTSTMFVQSPDPLSPGAEHYYNSAQKLFQVGQDSTLGITMWGLGGLTTTSYRTLIARFADLLVTQGAKSMGDVAASWAQFFWSAYSMDFAQAIQRVQQLLGQGTRTPEEEDELSWLRWRYSGGFCLGGYLMRDRTPGAFEMPFDPTLTSPSPPTPLAVGSARFWGCPNLIDRLIFGLDFPVFSAILNSGKWSGTSDDLLQVITPHSLRQPFDLPIREAVDWVHASIYTTIKAMKFSHLAPVCGGSIELAVITSDRMFRWVRHKRFDSAIVEGGASNA